MDEEGKGLFSVQEAAEAWGISRQAVYQRLNKLNKQGFTALQGKKRYITREGMEAYSKEVNQHDNQLEQEKTTFQPTFQAEVDRLKTALQAAEALASTLQATVTAQEAHIESLKQALDREQALHMASLQQRLPAGRGQGFFAWLRGKRTEGQGSRGE